MCCAHCSRDSQKETFEEFLKFCEQSGRGCRDLWTSFARGKASLGETVFKLEVVKIEYEHHGLATTINSCCTKRTHKFKGRPATCSPEFSNNTKDKRKHINSNYALNLRLAVSTVMNGGSQADTMRTAKLLSLKGIHAHSYQNVEKRLE